jgi:hypothetical protein
LAAAIVLREERKMGRSGSLDEAFPCTSWMQRAFRPARIPIRTPGGRGKGSRAAGAGNGAAASAARSALWQPDAADFGHPEAIARATVPRAWIT